MATHTMDRREEERAAGWLCLAAAPTFAIMALFSGISSAGPPSVCGLMPGPSPLSGMTCMYLLMSAFHSTPWLKLLTTRGRRV
jgi:hypothetical protein